MGGCASKPKESDTRESTPTEAPASPKQAEPVAQESHNEVSLAESKEEGEGATETKAADVEVVTAEAAEDVTAKPEEDEKAETTEEDDKVKVEAVEETPKEGQVEENKTEDSEDKSDAPLVTV